MTDIRQRRPAARGAALLAALPLGYVALSALLAWTAQDAVAAVRDPAQSAALGFDTWLALAAGLAAWCVLTWLALGLTVTVAVGLRGHPGGRATRAAEALTPRAVRRVAGLLLGASLVGATVGPATTARAAGATAGGGRETCPVASATYEPGASAQTVRPDAVLDGWTPDRPAAEPKRQAGADSLRLVTSAPRPHRSVGDAVVVRRGDTLWDLAARALGPDADAAEVANEWPRWHAANHVIGDDPHLLRPGQLLHPPRP